MSGNFDFKKFLKESKALEKSNSFLAEDFQKREKFRSIVNKIIKEELEEMYGSPDDYINPGNTEDQAREREEYLNTFGGPPTYEDAEGDEYPSTYKNVIDLTDMPIGEAKKDEEEEATKEEGEETKEEGEETEEVGDFGAEEDGEGEEETEFPSDEFGDEAASDTGELFSPEEQKMIDDIESALSTANKLDNPKLVTQIMNTLKFAQKASLTDEQ